MATQVRRMKMIVCAAAAMLVTAGATAWACQNVLSLPQVTVSPLSLSATTQMTVDGESWPPGSNVRLSVTDGNRQELQFVGILNADPNGHFVGSFPPPALPPGLYYLFGASDGVTHVSPGQFQILATDAPAATSPPSLYATTSAPDVGQPVGTPAPAAVTPQPSGPVSGAAPPAGPAPSPAGTTSPAAITDPADGSPLTASPSPGTALPVDIFAPGMPAAAAPDGAVPQIDPAAVGVTGDDSHPGVAADTSRLLWLGRADNQASAATVHQSGDSGADKPLLVLSIAVVLASAALGAFKWRGNRKPT